MAGYGIILLWYNWGLRLLGLREGGSSGFGWLALRHCDNGYAVEIVGNRCYVFERLL